MPTMTALNALLLAIGAAVLLVGCNKALRSAPADPNAAVQPVSGAEAKALVAEKNALLLDVRTPGEFSGGHIDGSINIPVQQLGKALQSGVPELADKDRPIVVYCRSGRRSANAAKMLEGAGYTQIRDMSRVGAYPR